MDQLIHKCKTIDKDLTRALNDCNSTSVRNAQNALRITTMTILVILEDVTFDLTKFGKWAFDNDITPFLQDLNVGHWGINCSPRFSNCVFFTHYLQHKKISIKLFRNGKLHITGLQSTQQALVYADLFCRLLQPHSTTTITTTDIDIQLINASFKFSLPKDKSFHLQNIKYVFESNGNTSVPLTFIFNNDQHSGLRIKFDLENTKITLMMFEKGSTLIQSFRNASQLKTSFYLISDLISNSNFDIILRDKFDIKRGIKRKKDFDYNAFL